MHADERSEAIDAVARRMTDVSPAVDLRDRILEQLEERPRGWRVDLSRPAALVAASLVAVLVIGTAALQNFLSLPMPRDLALAVSPGSPVRQAVAILQPLDAPSAPIDVALVAPVTPEISASELAWLARRIPALQQPSVAAVESIQPAELEIPLLAVEPLAPAPLTLRPLDTAPSGANR